jgi:NAD(P)-dependent dehydrogenase (short-subunit alcohol dehydrogenase family)
MTHRSVHQLFDLKGKTALVTGGSRGLGLQMAFALGEAGAKIMLSSRKASGSRQIALWKPIFTSWQTRLCSAWAM